jgi:hypothetical protein
MHVDTYATQVTEVPRKNGLAIEKFYVVPDHTIEHRGLAKLLAYLNKQDTSLENIYAEASRVQKSSQGMHMSAADTAGGRKKSDRHRESEETTPTMLNALTNMRPASHVNGNIQLAHAHAQIISDSGLAVSGQNDRLGLADRQTSVSSEYDISGPIRITDKQMPGSSESGTEPGSGEAAVLPGRIPGVLFEASQAMGCADGNARGDPFSYLKGRNSVPV